MICAKNICPLTINTRCKKEKEKMSLVNSRYELFHGLALVKLLRGEHPANLCMVGTNVKEEWSTYVVDINGVDIHNVRLFFKHSEKPSRRSKKTGAESWTFTFSPTQLNQLYKEDHRIVLICGFQDIKSAKEMQICFPKPEQIRELLDLSSPRTKSQNLTVSWEKGKSLRVSSPRVKKPLVVPRYAFSKWADGI